jgi:hypothetical protein
MFRQEQHNWWSPRRALWDTVEYTIGSVTNFVVYVWSSCSFYLQYKAVFGLLRHILMDSMNKIDSVVSMAWSHTYQFLPLGLSKGLNLPDRNRHGGQASALDSNGCDNNKTYPWKFFSVLVPGIHGVTVLCYTFRVMKNIFSNFCKHSVNIRVLLQFECNKCVLLLYYITCLIWFTDASIFHTWSGCSHMFIEAFWLDIRNRTHSLYLMHLIKNYLICDCMLWFANTAQSTNLENAL